MADTADIPSDIEQAATRFAGEYLAHDISCERLYRDVAALVMAERERCAKICEAEQVAMQRVADFHRPPRVDYDPALADMHDQGAAVAFKLAAAIRQP